MSPEAQAVAAAVEAIEAAVRSNYCEALKALGQVEPAASMGADDAAQQVGQLMARWLFTWLESPDEAALERAGGLLGL